uniref:Uncharacterized protein n=1 Tax=Setaria viridis TaxID=4556 RepID=A0A4U6VIL0_SETVI|nr:hypothetical protein SEVIR_3G397733v2 [Setaria viridis]
MGHTLHIHMHERKAPSPPLWRFGWVASLLQDAHRLVLSNAPFSVLCLCMCSCSFQRERTLQGTIMPSIFSVTPCVQCG